MTTLYLKVLSQCSLPPSSRRCTHFVQTTISPSDPFARCAPSATFHQQPPFSDHLTFTRAEWAAKSQDRSAGQASTFRPMYGYQIRRSRSPNPRHSPLPPHDHPHGTGPTYIRLDHSIPPDQRVNRSRRSPSPDLFPYAKRIRDNGYGPRGHAQLQPADAHPGPGSGAVPGPYPDARRRSSDTTPRSDGRCAT